MNEKHLTATPQLTRLTVRLSKAGLSRESLAEKIGFSRTRPGIWYQEGYIPEEPARRLGEFFNCDPAEFNERLERRSKVMAEDLVQELPQHLRASAMHIVRLMRATAERKPGEDYKQIKLDSEKRGPRDTLGAQKKMSDMLNIMKNCKNDVFHAKDFSGIFCISDQDARNMLCKAERLGIIVRVDVGAYKWRTK